MELRKTALSVTLIGLLAACSSDSDSGSGTGYVQMYNASANSPELHLEIDQTLRTSASYADVTTRHSYTPDNYELNYLYKNDNGDYVSLYDDVKSLDIRADRKNLHVFSGDFNQPVIHELDIPISDTDDEFKLGFFNTTEQSYDVYIANKDYDFVDAELLTQANPFALTELADFNEDNYTLYFTAAGKTDVLFKSDSIHFDDEQSYVGMIRPSLLAENISLDVVYSSNQVTNFQHQDAIAQIRFYNSVDNYEQVTFSASSHTNTITTALVENDTTSEYNNVESGTYSLSMFDQSGEPVVENYLAALEKDQSLAAFFYQHIDGDVRMLSVTENLSPNELTHQIEVINLIVQSPSDEEIIEINVYFTQANETIETTNNYIDDLKQYSSKSLTLDNQSYDLTVAFEQNSEERILLQQADVSFTDKGHYLLVLEEDESSDIGYKVKVINTIND